MYISVESAKLMCTYNMYMYKFGTWLDYRARPFLVLVCTMRGKKGLHVAKLTVGMQLN